jgi:serine/threonine protein kinase
MDCFKDKFVEGQLLDGRFLSIAPLNHGSFGMVFLAKDTKTGDDVAIKCLTKSAVTDCPVAIDDRSEEREYHVQLGHHPNIVNLIHSFETHAHIYLVLEYCSMGDLYEAIRVTRGPLETEHVRDFMLQLVSAVEFMHLNGLYHRDIKPENIFLMQDGSMKLGDFGLATRKPWCFEACVGSDRYMGPEQYDPPATGYSPAKADIWSIGICLLNILFARNPFVTPTESDILFADYVRDRQSLFDIFPNMSQDTFEILRNAMALDPAKRSLSAVREAIRRTVSFSTDDEALDDFCTEDRDLVPASANREPLRTPSIQSPQINAGDSFPWAKALQATPPQDIRQLSAIPDTESYSEDLFAPSETVGTSWCSVHPQTPSMGSVLDSALGVSARSMKMGRPVQQYSHSFEPVSMTASLPTQSVNPRPAMSVVFGGAGRRDQISKSWSDLWDEEESENEDFALEKRRENNARSWSQESKDDEASVRSDLQKQNASSLANSGLKTPPRVSSSEFSPMPVKAPGSENGSLHHPPIRPFRYTPPKQPSLDKWAALGDRRRNYRRKEENFPRKKPQNSTAAATTIPTTWRRDSGFGSLGFVMPSKKDFLTDHERYRNPFLDKDWRRDAVETFKPKPGKSSVKVYDGSADDDLDFVGGWHDLHL